VHIGWRKERRTSIQRGFETAGGGQKEMSGAKRNI
jgi:hypothetical protein